MIQKRVILCFVMVGVAAGLCSCRSPSGPMLSCDDDTKIKVVVVTGGHDFDRGSFFAAFDSFDDISYVESVQDDHSKLFETIGDWPFDVIVLHKMPQDLSPGRRENFQRLLDQGVGLLAIGHSPVVCSNWPEYKSILGGRYIQKETNENGAIVPQSKTPHGLEMKMSIKDTQHPITIGMSDFFIHDEAYGDYWFDETTHHLILGTDHLGHDNPIGWVGTYGKARVCYLQLGYVVEAYRDGNFRWLVQQAVRWCAGRLPEAIQTGPTVPLILPGLK